MDNAIKFALWLYNRQTENEQRSGETIEDNGIGFNKPDAMKLNAMLSALDDGIEFDKKSLANWYIHHLKPRLLKYNRQFQQYCHVRI
jgi:hypothetical protein